MKSYDSTVCLSGCDINASFLNAFFISSKLAKSDKLSTE
jgi:hypothetical protein